MLANGFKIAGIEALQSRLYKRICTLLYQIFCKQFYNIGVLVFETVSQIQKPTFLRF